MFLGWLHEPGDVFEVRSFDCPVEWGSNYKRTAAGWFDDVNAAAREALELESREPEGIYVSLNPVDRALLARASNRIDQPADKATSDRDVVRRRWIFVDIDPIRPSGISSTDAQLRCAGELAVRVRDQLRSQGWPEPLLCMSGNGAYALYRIDLPNDQDALDLISRVLKGLAEQFNTEYAEIDQTGKNAGRIIKLIGTIARKGENYQPADRPSAEHRPHRRSWFEVPSTPPEPVSREQLEAVATPAPEPTPPAAARGPRQANRQPNGQSEPNETGRPRNPSLDLPQWIDGHNVPVGEPQSWNGNGRRWVFSEAPPLCDHECDGSGFICQHANGAISAGCHHNHCTWGWRELRQHYEPRCYDNEGDHRVTHSRNAMSSRNGRATRQAHDDNSRCGGWLADQHQRTDNALATRFIDQYHEHVRYVPKWNLWLVWDGQRWKIDDNSTLLLKHARIYAQSLWDDLGSFVQQHQPNRDEYSPAQAFCKYANAQKGINASLALARADQRIMVDIADLDADPDLLNVQNGTVNLRTGEFHSHRREDLITQLAAVSYDASATCPRWQETCELIFDGAEDLIAYVKRVLGYSLSGDTGEHILPIAYGEGNNGKSTIWNAILDLAGDYGALAPESLLLGDKYGHPTEKAMLFGKRIVAISEPEQGAKLREARVKELTGDSTITARRMRENFWQFRRSHAFWLSTNHLPKVNGTDVGIWRRIKLIPFDVDISDKVEPVKEFHLWLVEHEGPGILNWLLQGYQSYLGEGFREPNRVTQASARYRQDQDHLGAFIADCCVTGDQCIETAGALYSAYRSWGGHWSQTAFGRAMADRFAKETPTSGIHRRQTVYRGVALCPS